MTGFFKLPGALTQLTLRNKVSSISVGKLFNKFSQAFDLVTFCGETVYDFTSTKNC